MMWFLIKGWQKEVKIYYSRKRTRTGVTGVGSDDLLGGIIVAM